MGRGEVLGKERDKRGWEGCRKKRIKDDRVKVYFLPGWQDGMRLW